MQCEFRIGHQHREFGARQAFAAGIALGDCRIARQEFELAIEHAAPFQRLHELHRIAVFLGALRDRERQAERLQIIVAQDERGDLIRHAGEKFIALRARQLALLLGAAKRDLDIDLHVGGSSPRRIVDGIGIDAAAACANSMRPRWVTARLAPSPMTLALSSLAQTRNWIIAAVAAFGIGFADAFT